VITLEFKRRVVAGYDSIAERLDRERGKGSEVARWLTRFADRLPRSARVLDLGCGAGTPHTFFLSQRFRTVGVDISQAQLQMATARVPAAHFLLADMSSLHIPPASFDGITAIYSLIHVPRDEQPHLLTAIRRWLKPNGAAFLVLGANDNPSGEETDWFGAPMLWSHYDSETNLRILNDAKLRVLASALEPDPTDPTGHHLFTLCRAAG
jgi:ubiquinone/menaquinone biosynthesis C-methylase UbiE